MRTYHTEYQARKPRGPRALGWRAPPGGPARRCDRRQAPHCAEAWLDGRHRPQRRHAERLRAAIAVLEEARERPHREEAPERDRSSSGGALGRLDSVVSPRPTPRGEAGRGSARRRAADEIVTPQVTASPPTALIAAAWPRSSTPLALRTGSGCPLGRRVARSRWPGGPATDRGRPASDPNVTSVPGGQRRLSRQPDRGNSTLSVVRALRRSPTLFVERSPRAHATSWCATGTCSLSQESAAVRPASTELRRLPPASVPRTTTAVEIMQKRLSSMLYR